MPNRRLASLFLLLPTAVAAGQAPDAADMPDRAKLEQEFTEKLTNVVLVGTFTIVTPEGMSEGKTERYTIKSVRKIRGDTWLFEARVQYGERDVTVPMPLTVLWAGETPMVYMENTSIPGLGTYSARVLFYRDLYSAPGSRPATTARSAGESSSRTTRPRPTPRPQRSRRTAPAPPVTSESNSERRGTNGASSAGER